MFISVIQINLAAAACTVAALCFTLLYMNSRRRRRRSSTVVVEWQNLPADILFLIAQRSEIRRLRAVCSSWRSSLPLPDKAHHPLRSAKIPLPLFLFDQRASLSSYLTLIERNIYCLEPLGNDDADSPKSCWMVKLEDFMSSGKIHFRNALSHRFIPTRELNLPAVVDFLDCRAILVGKEYNFIFMSCRCKVVLSDDAMLCCYDKQKLGYFKFGDERWTEIDRGDDELSYSTSDIIYHKQKFYVVDLRGKLIVFDSLLKIEVFVSPARVHVDREHLSVEWLFVQSDGDLFVVNKYYRIDGQQQMVCFKVYKLNSDEQQWNEVTDLGDQSFFISSGGCHFSINIGSAQFSGCGKNFIYFGEYNKAISSEPGDNIGIFSLEDNSSRPLHTISRYNRLFGPIPSWLKQG